VACVFVEGCMRYTFIVSLCLLLQGRDFGCWVCSNMFAYEISWFADVSSKQISKKCKFKNLLFGAKRFTLDGPTMRVGVGGWSGAGGKGSFGSGRQQCLHETHRRARSCSDAGSSQATWLSCVRLQHHCLSYSSPSRADLPGQSERRCVVVRGFRC